LFFSGNLKNIRGASTDFFLNPHFIGVKIVVFVEKIFALRKNFEVSMNLLRILTLPP
jgi:hypothetical protein